MTETSESIVRRIFLSLFPPLLEQDRLPKGKIPSHRRRPSRTLSTTFFFGTISELFRYRCDSRIGEQYKKNLNKEQQAKDSQNRSKNFNRRHNRSGRKRVQACGLQERSGKEEEAYRSPLPLRNLYTCARLRQQQARKALQIHDSGKRAARERERERTEPHLIKEINPS